METQVGMVRLNLLRLAYAIMAIGLAVFVWPQVLAHTPEFARESGIRVSLLAGLGFTAALGLRYPLAMLPVLLFELTWKAIYLAAFAWPLWRAHAIDATAAADIQAVLMAVIFIPLIPWDYVAARYIRNPGERWI